MKLLSILILFFSAQVQADSCMKEANSFVELVAVKWGVNSSIEKNPDKYKEELWQYIHDLSEDIFKEGKFGKERAVEVAKLLANNNFSENPEVEVNIFEDYWLLSCRAIKKGSKPTPLSEISKDSLLECWNSVASREEFQECIRPLVIQN